MALGVGDTLEARGLGAVKAPSGVQGQHPIGGPGGEAPGSKMDLVFSHLLKLPFLRAVNSTCITLCS